MATPNIVNVATINAANSTALLDGTSRTEALDVPADKVAKINTILIANVDGTNAANITIEVSIDNGSNYVKIANLTKGLSGADLRSLCVEAVISAIHENRKSVSSEDFDKAIKKVSQRLPDMDSPADPEVDLYN